jgi:hypothetical protein
MAEVKRFVTSKYNILCLEILGIWLLVQLFYFPVLLFQ